MKSRAGTAMRWFRPTVTCRNCAALVPAYRHVPELRCACSGLLCLRIQLQDSCNYAALLAEHPIDVALAEKHCLPESVEGWKAASSVEVLRTSTSSPANSATRNPAVHRAWAPGAPPGMRLTRKVLSGKWHTQSRPPPSPGARRVAHVPATSRIAHFVLGTLTSCEP